MHSTRRFSIVLTAVLTYLLTLSSSAHADAKSEAKCRASIIKASAAFVQAKVKAFQKCEESIVKGKFGGPCPDTAKAGPKIAKAADKLRTTVAKACGGKDKTCGAGGDDEPLASTGFPNPCPNFENGACTNAVTHCGHISDCLFCIGEAAVDQAMDLYYGDLVPNTTADKVLNKCQVTIGKETAKFFVAKSKALQKCWDSVNKGKIPGPCPDAAKAAPKIASAEAKKIAKICKACGGDDKACGGGDDLTPAEIGFRGTCDAVDPPGSEPACGGAVATLQNLVDCVDCVTEFKVDCVDLLAASDTLTGGAYPFQCNPGASPPTPTPTVVPTPAPCNPIDNRRCTGNTRTECTSNGDCASAGGTCQFFFGAPLPLAAGGVSTCVTNQFNGPVSGTFNEGTGSSAGTANLISRVYSGPILAEPCPRCNGDATKNDGVKGGTCSAGDNAMLTCDANGSSSFPQTFGDTSLDCPPLGGGLIATLPIDLTNTTGTATKTLAASGPNCTAAGFTTFECFCSTCNNGNQEPCDDNGDCPDPPGPTGAICGGLRCIGGGNAGTPCAVGSECPGGACSRPGAATKPSDCDGGPDDCVPDGGNEGICMIGPFNQFCSPVETYRGCTTNVDCTFAGDTCSLGKFRDCFPDKGVVGGSVSATGVVDPPTTAGDGHNEADPTLASLFCIGPTSSSAVNSAGGIPGLGRLELPGHAVDDSTLTLCPTTITFLPTAGNLGVLDAGWTGLAHDSKVIDCGLVTVSVTGCSGGGQPACGICTYTGPIPNPGAP